MYRCRSTQHLRLSHGGLPTVLALQLRTRSERQANLRLWQVKQCDEKGLPLRSFSRLNSMKTSVRLALSVLMMLVLVGCATKWGHPTNSENDFYSDQAQCNQVAQSNNPDTSLSFDPRLQGFDRARQDMYNGGAQMGRAIGLATVFNNCMMAKGYRKQ